MKTVLVIEDNLILRDNACEMLELKGYKAISAGNGKTGIASARTNRPDIIICDILMPEADGYEVFDALKSDPVTSVIPFIFLTASAHKQDIDDRLGVGSVGYIRKPFEAKEFFETIEFCLNT